MLTLYPTVDEQKLIEKLPVYAAANLLRIPFMNADSMHVVHMALPYLTLPYLRGGQVVTPAQDRRIFLFYHALKRSLG